MKFMVTVWAAFLARVKPVSTMANPACMNMTRNPATRVQTRLMELVLSATALATSSSFGGAASAMSIAAVAKVMGLLEQGNWKQPVQRPDHRPGELAPLWNDKFASDEKVGTATRADTCVAIASASGGASLPRNGR